MAKLTMHEALQKGAQLIQAGRPAEAESLYRKILALQPDQPDALHGLGILASQGGRYDQALELIGRAIAVNPEVAAYHCNLAVNLQALQRLEEATSAYRKAVELQPGLPEFQLNLGNSLAAQGRLEDAIVSYRKVLETGSHDADAHLGIAYALRDLGRHEEALGAFQKALRARPEFPEALNALGCLLTDLRKLDEAAAVLAEAIRLQPDFAIAHSNLGNVLNVQGLLDASLACDDRAIALEPQEPRFHSNRIYTLHFHPDFDGPALLREQMAWDERHGRPLGVRLHSQLNHPSPDRRLRIGYVSPDFRAHAVGRNILPLFREHDHQAVEVFCYSDVTRPDDVTAQFRNYADGWREIADWSHHRIADQVGSDRIDILVDLTLHMANNRLPAFALKPAPIQVTFGGYPGGTGLQAMDYRLTDPYLDPPGETDAHYVERSIRLPHSFWCYDVASMSRGLGHEPAVNALPALENGCITFGCLSNFCKINEPVLRLWARVLRAVEGSRLLVLANEGSHQHRTLGFLGQEGIAPERIEFVPGLPWLQYLEYYHRIDIGLDTLPYNGHTTSLEACRMGVPVVTKTGSTVVGRAGLSLFSNLGLTNLVASSDDRFVDIAQDLAQDLPRLIKLRAELRDRIQASPLMDAPLFARGIESAFRGMWHRACIANKG